MSHIDPDGCRFGRCEHGPIDRSYQAIIPVPHGQRNMMPGNAALYDALVESAYALKKHGPATKDPIRGIAVLTEELGEAAEQALKATSFDPDEHCGQPVRDRLQLLRHELAQTAGYALLQMQNIDNGETEVWIRETQSPTRL